MANIQPYESKVLPQGGLNTRQATSADLGFGQGVTALGQGMEAYAHTKNTLEENTEVSDIQANMAKFRAKVNEDYIKAKTDASPGDMEFSERFTSGITQQLDEMKRNVRTRQGMEVFNRLSSSVVEHYATSSAGYQADLAADKARLDVKTNRDANGAVILQDPTQFNSILENDKAVIGGGKGLNANLNKVQREALIHDNAQHYAIQANLGQITRDPLGWMKSSGVEPVGTKQNGTLVGASPRGGISFDAAVNKVLGTEGGYNSSDGNSGAPVNFGINQGANPDINVKNLTPEKAKELYKSRYWDAIGADNLPAGLRMSAFDAAVNQGVGWTKQALAESGGDPAKFNQLRIQHYKDIAENDPRQAKYLSAWLARVKSSSAADGGGGDYPFPSYEKSVAANPSLKYLTPEQFMHLATQAQTRANQQMTLMQGQIEHTMKNQLAEATATGQITTPEISREQFRTAYGVEGDRMYDTQYAPTIKMAKDIQNVFAMPLDQQQKYIDALRPQAGDAEFAVKQQHYDKFTSLVDAARKQRAADVWDFAESHKLPGVTRLEGMGPNNLDFDKVFQGIGARVGQATKFASDFGATAVKTLSNQDAATLGQAFRNMTGEGKAAFLFKLNAAVSDPEAFKATMQQIAPDSPIAVPMAKLLSNTSQVAIKSNLFSPDVVTNAKDVVKMVMTGDQLLNKLPTEKDKDGKGRGFDMPSEKKLNEAFHQYVGESFSAADPRAAAANTDTAYQAFRAYYAAYVAKNSSRQDADQPNPEAVNAATRAVLGEAVKVNGSKVLAPWGMTSNTFSSQLRGHFDAVINQYGWKNTNANNFSAYRMEGVGDGKYRLANGNSYLQAPDGRPIEIDVTKPVPQLKAAVTGAGPETFQHKFATQSPDRMDNLARAREKAAADRRAWFAGVLGQ